MMDRLKKIFRSKRDAVEEPQEEAESSTNGDWAWGHPHALDPEYDWQNEYYCKWCSSWTDGCRHGWQEE